jgi:hypothetical protein
VLALPPLRSRGGVCEIIFSIQTLRIAAVSDSQCMVCRRAKERGSDPAISSSPRWMILQVLSCRYTVAPETFTLFCFLSRVDSVESNFKPSGGCWTETARRRESIRRFALNQRARHCCGIYVPIYVTALCTEGEQGFATCSCGLHDSLFCILHHLDGKAVKRRRTEAHTEPTPPRCSPLPTIFLVR